MKSVVVHNIHKSYGNVTALSGVDFDVSKGEIFGIIGPDGAGKTTLFRIMTTLLLADQGECRVENLDVVKDYKKIRKLVGYMPGRFSLYQDMSVEENLTFFSSLFHTTIKDNYHLVEDIYKQLEPFKKRRAGKLSGGMKQKLALCCALIHRPSILFLDEPTTGVDPVSRKEFWNILRRIKNDGITVVVSTPYMDEANLCDRIALVKKGKFMSINTPEDIIKGFNIPLYQVKSEEMFSLLKNLRLYDEIDNCYVSGEYHHFTTREREFDIDALLAFLSEKGHKKNIVELIPANIEDCYIRLAKDK